MVVSKWCHALRPDYASLVTLTVRNGVSPEPLDGRPSPPHVPDGRFCGTGGTMPRKKKGKPKVKCYTRFGERIAALASRQWEL